MSLKVRAEYWRRINNINRFEEDLDDEDETPNIKECLICGSKFNAGSGWENPCPYCPGDTKI